MTCDSCDYMHSVALPDHYQEVRTMAYREAQRWGVDPLTLAERATATMDTGEHPGGHWQQLAVIRRELLGMTGYTSIIDLERSMT